jgi:hypothetical protein
MQSDRTVGQLGFQQAGDKPGSFFFGYFVMRQIGGDDVEREEEVGAGVGD